MTEKKKQYTLKVWGKNMPCRVYNVKGKPPLAVHTNDIAIEFERPDGRMILVSANCAWVLEEQAP